MPNPNYEITSNISVCFWTCEEGDLMVRNIYWFKQIGAHFGED